MKLALTALVAFLLLATTAAYAQEDPEFEDMELKLYDVSMLVTPHRSQIGPRLGPWSRYQWEEEYEDFEPTAFFEGDALADLIRDTIEPDSWDTGYSDVQYREGGKLIVRNLPEVNRKIEALLQDLGASAGRRIRISTELYELPADAWEEIQAGTAPNEIPKAALIASGSTETMSGVQVVLKVTNRVRYVSDYDVEIAQGSNLSDPLVGSPDEGFAMEILPRATLDGDRIVMQCVEQNGRFLRPFRTQELGTDEEYFAEGFRSDRRFSHGKLELPVYEEANAFFTRVSRSGESFVVPILREKKLFALTVNARVVGRGGLAGLYDIGAMTGRLRNSWFGFPEEFEPEYVAIFAPQFYSGGEYYRRLLGGAEDIMDLVVQNVEPWAWDEDASLGISGESKFYVHADDNVRRQVESFLRTRESEAVTPVTLDVAVYSVTGPFDTGESNAEPPAGAVLKYGTRLDTLPHLRAGLQAGSRAAFLADYDVEVAQESRIADPIVGHAFDGITGNFLPRLSLDRKRMSVELSMLLCHRGSFSTYLSGTQYLGPVDRFDTARTVLNQTIEMANGGTYWIDAGTDPADPRRRIAVRIGARLN